MLGSNLTSWAANAVKFQHKLSNQIQIKTRQKRSGNGMKDKNKNDTKFGKCK